jgi:nitrate reductase NapAB chaperone NapD
MVVAVALLLLAGLPCMESSSSFASNIRTRLLHQFKPPKLEPVVQVNITQEVVVERRRSLMESAVVNIRSVGWRGVAVGGAVVASGLLTSAIVQAARRRLAEQAVSIVSNITEIIDVDPTDRLDSMLRNTALSIQNIDNATSVILVFDSDDSQTSEEKLELKKDSLNLIAAEVAKARSEGEKVRMCGGW